MGCLALFCTLAGSWALPPSTIQVHMDLEDPKARKNHRLNSPLVVFKFFKEVLVNEFVIEPPQKEPRHC